MKGIIDGTFPLDNLAFVLFMETVRFFSTKNTSEMRYSDTSKLFWKTGYRLFHTKFLYFMGGPKNIGQISDGVDESGMLRSKNALINFAVPSVQRLTEFNTSNAVLGKTVPPGVLYPVVEALKASDHFKDSEYMLCADAKKVTAGIDAKGGDVDMFGNERGEKLTERRERLFNDVNQINEIKKHLSTNVDPEIVPKLNSTVNTISLRLAETRDLAVRQTFGLNKFKRMGGDNWKDSRYVYVISGLQASLYRLGEFSRDALTTIGNLLSLSSNIQRSISPYVLENRLDFVAQSNIAMLRESNDSLVEIEPRYVKQRSDIWFEVRKQARVTGSTLHSAIGLRGLKEKQNHFVKFIEGIDFPIPSEVQARLSHGTKHECDAIATLIGRFLPSYYPKAIFVEEGCYVLPDDTSEIFCVVSPDGSIRTSIDGEVIAAVEIKCPFPSEKQTPVHYKLPDYYVCQCLAEMYVLKTDQLLYISYSEESTTFFKVKFSTELWDCVWNQALEDYSTNKLTKPTRNGNLVKEIKCKIKEFTVSNVEVICEIPSCTARSDVCLPEDTANGYYFCAEQDRREERYRESNFNEILHTLDDAVKVIENGYDILRQRATEVMMWVITNKNRNSSTQMPCSLPIAYGLKDYRLTSNLMRSATDHVLRECTKHGIKVLSFAADGQWIQLMSRDSAGKPLTIYQFQKDFWDSTKQFSKTELVKRVAKVHRSDPEDPLKDKVIRKRQDGVIEVSTIANSFSAIETPVDRKLWCKKKDPGTKETTSSESSIESVNHDWLPASVVNDLDKNENDSVRSLITEMSKEFETEPIHQESEEVNIAEIDMNFTEIQTCTNNESNIVRPDDSDLKASAIVTRREIVNCTGPTQSHGLDKNQVCSINVQQLLSSILKYLQTDQNTLNRWNERAETYLEKCLSSVQGLWDLTHSELNAIYSSIADNIPEPQRKYAKSWRKPQKIDFFAEIFGLTTVPTERPNLSRMKNPKPLKELSVKILQSKQYPKLVLRSAFAKYAFSFALSEWQSEAPFPCPMQIEGIEEAIPFWFSYPERSTATGNLLCKSIDCSHNFTHLRVRTSTTGFCGISSHAWKECAKSNETSLTLPHVEDLIDKQSVPNARTHFSEEVEIWMREHGYNAPAALTKLIREWYEACDTPGISATERITKLLSMRTLLLKDVNFFNFPPEGRYFNGTPVVTFEGMLIDIDTKIQMHNLTDTFNIRSIGSLAAETTVGILQSLYPTSQVDIKARDVPSLMSSVVDVMACKTNPERYIIPVYFQKQSS
jgi:hypothetical protein